MSQNGRRRLTSWKEIAQHVGRDVRTVLRWEKERGLPVHRVPGANGRVVFAWVDELDAWAEGDRRDPTPVPQPVPGTADPLPAIGSRSLPRLALATLLILATVAVVWAARQPALALIPLTIAITDNEIVARASTGQERWRHRLNAEEKAIQLPQRAANPGAIAGGDILAGVSYTMRLNDLSPRGGELFRFSTAGALKDRFSFDSTLSFGRGPYGPPWVVADFRVDQRAGGYRVAVAAHHYEWWPSMVTILDDKWKRRGTFVNAGWIERVHWVSPDRLAIAGFANEMDGGMIALLDAAGLSGQSPAAEGSEFHCAGCGPATPLRYIVLPRSEVNRATGSPFNRTVLGVKHDMLVARTIEVPANTHAIDALYEFSPALELLRATYSDRYWDMHRELEAAGKIAHPRERCPDRDGPRQILVWEPETGWVTMPTAPEPGRRHSSRH